MTTKNRRKDKKRLKKNLEKAIVKELGINEKKIKVKIVELNNKTRKGKYVYIKLPRKKARYYKEKEGIKIKDYVKAYKGKVKINKSGVIEPKEKKDSEKYLDKIRKGPKIDNIISKGISENGEVPNLYSADRAVIRKAYKDMLRPLVKDETLVNVLALEENVEKFKYRIETRIKIVNEKGDKAINLTAYNKSIDEIFNDFGKILNKKDVYTEDLKILKERGYNVIDLEGIDIKSTYEGKNIIPKVDKIKLNLKYVKGK